MLALTGTIGVCALAWTWLAMPALPQSAAQPGPDGPVPRIGVEALARGRAAAAVLFVDVRSDDAFRQGHIAGARHVPVPELEARAASVLEAAAGRPIVTYCSCSAEQTSVYAAQLLRRRGATRVLALAGGFPAWVASGGPVETGPPRRR